MSPSLLDILLSDEAAKAICWTLVHSLWEGTLAALVAGLIILGTRKQPAALRYNALTAIMAVFIIGTGITFYYQFKTTPREAHLSPIIRTHGSSTVQPEQRDNIPGQYTNIPQQHDNGFTAQTTPAVTFRTAIQRANDYLNTHAALVTLIWLACMLAQLIRLTGGLYRIHRLRRDSTIPPEEYWLEKLTLLTRQLGIKRTVTLLQSHWIKAPAAFGFLKPAILVPLGFLAQLPPHQVETILLHELAHIRRSDYLANLLLHLTEAIFFFNPGIRWIAALIRREREACCDDMVLAGTPDGHNYFEALVAFTQLTIDSRTNTRWHAYTLQLGGSKKTDLFWRMKRMLEKENKKLHLLEKTILSFALLALVSFSLIKPRPAADPKALQERSNTAAKSAPAPPPPPVPPVAADTLPRKFAFNSLTGHSTTTGDLHTYKGKGRANDGHTYDIRKRNEEIIEFKIDGKRIARENYVNYLRVLAEFATKENSQRQTLFQAAQPADPFSLLPPPITVANLVDTINKLRANRPADPFGVPAQVDNTPHRERPPTVDYPLVFSNNPNIDVLHIAVDLVKAHLITDVKKYEFALDADKLIVNGERQPDNIFQKFKEKYIHGPNDNFEYSQYWITGGSGSHCIVHTPNHGENLTNVY